MVYETNTFDSMTLDSEHQLNHFLLLLLISSSSCRLEAFCFGIPKVVAQNKQKGKKNESKGSAKPLVT